MSVRLGKLEDSYLLECVAASWGGGVLTISKEYWGSHPSPQKKRRHISHTRTLSYTAAEIFNLLYLLSFLFELFRQILLILADIFPYSMFSVFLLHFVFFMHTSVLRLATD